MTTLTIIRGLPGSGKSTYAQKNFKNAVHLEADMYFVDESGEYKFNVALLSQAHKWCQNATKYYLDKGQDVVVSNTFTTCKEINPYLLIAKKANADFDVIRLDSQFGSVHNVPDETIEKMRGRFVDFEGENIVK